MKQCDFAIRGYQIETKEGFEWVIEYPELPGVTGGGVSYEEALREAEDNKRFYFDYLQESGRSIPAPSEVADLGDLSGKITLRLSKSLHQSIILRAQVERVSINALINEVLSTYLAARDAQKFVEVVLTGNATLKRTDADPAYVIQERRKTVRRSSGR
ncbi:MAG TPA: hypothetical protein DCR44_00130 [Acholeplasmatales bacterium]|nr:MAG: hypothetical protein A2Y16_01555 [Tenericutes bacterium GWF2_57_13]HAQ55811.1 hypothetical protein [Acholeplasmatales bacterium]